MIVARYFDFMLYVREFACPSVVDPSSFSSLPRHEWILLKIRSCIGIIGIGLSKFSQAYFYIFEIFKYFLKNSLFTYLIMNSHKTNQIWVMTLLILRVNWSNLNVIWNQPYLSKNWKIWTACFWANLSWIVYFSG